MDILVLNCGSSSVKFQLLNVNGDHELICSGIIERIGTQSSFLKYNKVGKDTLKINEFIEDHSQGIKLIIDTLLNEDYGVIGSVDEIFAIGHRVAHGGEYFSSSVLISPEVKQKIADLIPLAPLHNPAHIKGIEAIEKITPHKPQVAVFDTSFYANLDKKVYMYPVNHEVYDKYRIRKYGFHGTSHKFVAEKASKMIGKDLKDLKVITCHLGNGASITAIKNGKAFDTSMGFTPLDGIMMGTRSGSIDPGVIFYLNEQKGLGIEGINKMLNSQSGVQGISEYSSDMRDMQKAKAEGNKKAALALDMYAYRIKHYIGAYTANMGGLDLLVFTGGVGENQYLIRKDVCENMEYLGIDLDLEVNDKTRAIDKILSANSSRVKVALVTTNEELVIAQDTYNIVKTMI
jgi:acetate kinase